MRIAIAALALVLAHLPAAATEPSPLKGCWVETSVAGTFLAAGPREAQGGIGIGCDATLDKLVVGAVLRADHGDTTSGSLAAKAGLALNPHLHLYGLAEWRALEWRVRDAGQLQLGAGVETSVLVNGLSAFVEGSTAVAKFGPAATRDDILVRLGGRYRF